MVSFQTQSYPVVFEERNSLLGLFGLVLFALIGSLVILLTLAVSIGSFASPAGKGLAVVTLSVFILALLGFAIVLKRLVSRAIQRSRGAARIRIDEKGLSYALKGQAFDVEWKSVKSIESADKHGFLVGVLAFFAPDALSRSGVDENEQHIEILVDKPVPVTSYPFGRARVTSTTKIGLSEAVYSGEKLLDILRRHFEAHRL